MPTDIDQSLDDIIKQKRQRNTKKPANKKIQKKIRSNQQLQTTSKKTNLKTRSLRPTAPRGGSGAQLGGGKQRRRVPQKKVPTAPPGMSTRLQIVSQGGNAKSKARKNLLGVRSGGVASKGKNLKSKKGFALSNQPKRGANVNMSKALPLPPEVQQLQQQPRPSTSPAQSLQISVKGPYSRQVDTDPMGIDMGEVPIHTTSMTTNVRFSSIEATREMTSPPPPPVAAQPPFTRRLRVNRGGNLG